MSRIPIPSREEAPQASQPVLDAVTKQLGFTPNLFKVLALSPNAIASWAGLQAPLSKTLDAKTRDAIALAVSQANECHYCLCAHTHIATTLAKVTPDEAVRNRQGLSDDPKIGAAASFAKKLIESRGAVSDGDLADVKQAGYSDANVVEMIALSTQFLFPNFINNVFDTDIDFPVVDQEVA